MCTSRSQMASAIVGSPRASCQLFVGNCEVMTDDGRGLAVSVLQDLEQIAPLGVSEGREKKVVEHEDIDLCDASEGGVVVS